MENEDLTPEAQPEGGDNGAVGDGSVAVADLSLNELNEALGKEYPNKETALKSIKDTFSYTGMKKEQIKAELAKEMSIDDLSQKMSSLENQLRDANFYADNPQFKPYKAMIDKFGGSPQDAVKDPIFQETFKKVSAFDETEKSKSVLHSNPRLGKVTDKMTEARKASAEGNLAQAETSAVDAVLSAFEK
jgi:hypothetical protein